MRRKLSILLAILFFCGTMTFVSAQEGCYETFRQEGLKLLRQNKCEEAINEFNLAKNCSDYDPKNNDIDRLIRQAEICEKIVYDKLEVSSHNFTIASFRDSIVVTIKASGKWKIEDLPDWCEKIEEKDTLKIFCDENKESYPRSGSFKIVMGKLSEIVQIKQNAQPKTPAGKLFFTTNVSHTFFDIGKGKQSTAFPTDEMEAKEHRVLITKEGYFPVDTTVVVPDGSTKTINIVMRPKFAILKLGIIATDGWPVENPKMRINNEINLSILDENSTTLILNEAEEIANFRLYKDGIPLPKGTYNIEINADGFENYLTKISVKEGDVKLLKVQMKPFSKHFTIMDNGGANGAKVFLDNRYVGEMPLHKEVRIGHYKLRFEKEGFKTPEDYYDIEIKDDKDNSNVFSITMAPFTKYLFTSDPDGAEIIVNNKRVGFTPSDSISIEEGSNVVLIKKNGFWDYKRNININNKQTTIHAKLEATYPITVKSEEEGLRMVIKRNRDTIISGMVPAQLQLPLGNYELTLYDGYNEERKKYVGKRYSGNFVFDTSKTIVDVPCYSWGTFTALVGNYFMLKSEVQNGKKTVSHYNLLANFHFGRFNILPGLSTSILRTSMFNVGDNFKGAVINVKKEGVDVNVDKSKYSDFMFSMSCLFLNGEFRMGGYLSRHLDICMLGSYVWYPDATNFIAVPQINGHEIFIGVEFTSRISYFNVNFKFGKEIYKGNYNFLVNKTGKAIRINSQIYSDKFYSTPFDLNGFTATIGFTLGQKISRGNNILRLW